MHSVPEIRGAVKDGLGPKHKNRKEGQKTPLGAKIGRRHFAATGRSRYHGNGGQTLLARPDSWKGTSHAYMLPNPTDQRNHAGWRCTGDDLGRIGAGRCPPAAQLRDRLHRRPGLPGRGLLRLARYQDAQPGPDGQGGHEVYELLRLAGGLLGIAGRADDRVLQRSCRYLGGLGARGETRDQRRRVDRCRGGQTAGLRHRDLRQVAPGPPSEVPAHPARFRRLLRAALLERHVAVSPHGHPFPGPAADRGREGDQRKRHGRGPDSPDHLVHRTGGEVHREEPAAALPGLCAPLDAARAVVRLREVQGQVEAGDLRRRDHGDRLVGGPDTENAREAGPGRQHAGDLHLRQRALAFLRRPRRLCVAVAGGQGHDVRRRLSRGVHHALARQDPRWGRVRRGGRHDRRVAHDRLPGGRRAA